MSVLFISPTALKESTVINENVDEKKITPIIVECQDMYLLPILGTGLYNELQTQVTAGSVTDLNRTLLNSYVVPCLKAYIMYEAPPYLNYNFTNKNVGKKNSEDSQPLSDVEMQKLMDRLKDKAEWRAERVTKYLLANSDSYPLFLNPGTGIDVVRPNGSNYTTGILLDDYFCPKCGRSNCNCIIQWGNLTIDL
jgi:hypothetical protein